MLVEESVEGIAFVEATKVMPEEFIRNVLRLGYAAPAPVVAALRRLALRKLTSV